MAASEKVHLRWGVEQRLEFIEFRLFWEGHVNRIDIMQQFGVSTNQASTDLNRYIGMAPTNIVYDKRACRGRIHLSRQRRSGSSA